MDKHLHELEDNCECCGLDRQECECPEDCENCTCKQVKEGFVFDKFMDAILVNENVGRRVIPSHNDSPQRERARRHQERPINRIKYRG